MSFIGIRKARKITADERSAKDFPFQSTLTSAPPISVTSNGHLPEPQAVTPKAMIKQAVDKAMKEAHKIRDGWEPHPVHGVPKLFGLDPKEFHIVSRPSGGWRVEGGRRPTTESAGQVRAFDSTPKQLKGRNELIARPDAEEGIAINEGQKKKTRPISEAWDKLLSVPNRPGAARHSFPETSHHIFAPMAHVAAALMHRGWSPERTHQELTNNKNNSMHNVYNATSNNTYGSELEELHDELMSHVDVGHASQMGPFTEELYMNTLGSGEYPVAPPPGHERQPILGNLGLGKLTLMSLVHRLGADAISNDNRTEHSQTMTEKAKLAAQYGASQFGDMIQQITQAAERERTGGQSEPYNQFKDMMMGAVETGESDRSKWRGSQHSEDIATLLRPGPKAGTTWEDEGWGSLRPEYGAQVHRPPRIIQPLGHNSQPDDSWSQTKLTDWPAWQPGDPETSFDTPTRVVDPDDDDSLNLGEPMDIAYRLLKGWLDDDVTTQPDQPVQAPAEEEQQRLALGIVGSRDFHDLERFDDKMGEWIDIHGMPTHVVSGGAQGADAMAQQWADDNEIPFIVHKPNYRAHGQYDATGQRNKKIVDSSDHILAFPSIHGGGTMNTVQHALAAKKPVHMHYIEHPADTPLEQVKPNERQATGYEDAWLTPDDGGGRREVEDDDSPPTTPRRQSGAARGQRGRQDDNVETGEPMDIAYRLLKLGVAGPSNPAYASSEQEGDEGDDACCRDAKARFREISEGSSFLGGAWSPNDQYMECAEFEQYLTQEIEGMQDMADVPMVAQAISDMKGILEDWENCDGAGQGMPEFQSINTGEPMDISYRLLKQGIDDYAQRDPTESIQVQKPDVPYELTSTNEGEFEDTGQGYGGQGDPACCEQAKEQIIEMKTRMNRPTHPAEDYDGWHDNLMDSPETGPLVQEIMDLDPEAGEQAKREMFESMNNDPDVSGRMDTHHQGNMERYTQWLRELNASVNSIECQTLKEILGVVKDGHGADVIDFLPGEVEETGAIYDEWVECDGIMDEGFGEDMGHLASEDGPIDLAWGILK